MRLHLIRHPAPQVAPGVCYGRSNPAVTQAAIDAALALCLPDLPEEKMVFFVSPLTRCVQFAMQLWQQRPFGRAIFDPRLMEMDFGTWELQPWDQIARQEIDAWVLDPAHYRPGAGDSVFQMACRVQQFYHQIQQQISQQIRPQNLPQIRPHQQQAVVICHAGTIRLLHACQLHDDPLQIALHASQANMRIGYGQLITLDLAPPA